MQIVMQAAPQIVPMSMHKFASNVVEKCLIFCSIAERDILVGDPGSVLAEAPSDY